EGCGCSGVCGGRPQGNRLFVCLEPLCSNGCLRSKSDRLGMITRWWMECCKPGIDSCVTIHKSIVRARDRLFGARSAADTKSCRLMPVVVSAAMLLAQPIYARQAAPPPGQASQGQTPPSPAAPSSQPVLAPLPTTGPVRISEPAKNHPDIPATP